MRPARQPCSPRLRHSPKGRRRILIVKLTSIGDVVLSLPALETLRIARPDDFIAWVVEDRAASLLQDHPLLDEVVVMPRKRWRRIRQQKGRFAAARAMWEFRSQLRALRFDLAFDLQGNIKSGLVGWASRARRRFGFARQDNREPNWLFTHERLPPQPADQHRVDRDLNLLASAGIADVGTAKADFGDRGITPPCGSDEMIRVNAWLAEHLESARPLVVLIPGTSEWLKTKRWPLARYAEVARQLHETENAQVLLIGGPGEDDLLDQIMAAAPLATTKPDQFWSMKELAALFLRSDLVIGSETGPVHLAATMGTPTLSLFGPYDPQALFPYGNPEMALYAAVPCSPCRYRACPRPVCMTEISMAKVAGSATQILRGETLPPASLIPQKTIFLRS